MRSVRVDATFYASLLRFLLQGKQGLIASGSSLGLSAMQAMTLLFAEEGKPRSMNYYRKMYGCDASNITGIVDGLEQKGLVSRHELPHDRRTKVIELEPAGIALRTELIERVMEENEHHFDQLNDQEMEQFQQIMTKLEPLEQNQGATVSA